jgi:hypothetical protein
MAQTAKRKPKADYEAQQTTTHEKIKQWAEERGGHPAVVEGTEILRIDFDEPGGNDDEALRRIGWEELFRVFDERDLEFLCQEHTQDGNLSRFNKFVRRGSGREDR